MEPEALRSRMVEEQLARRGIRQRRVLEAFRKVPRHVFVSPEERDTAYGDYPLPIGEGQTISQPYMVALMTECLALEGNEVALEVGTGSGYQTAILAELVRQVYSVERIGALAESAALRLKGLGYSNIKIKTGDGTLGWAEHAPYDAIIVTAGAPDMPDTLVGQLKEGGRMVIPVGGNLSQVLTVLEKKKDKLTTQEVSGCVFVPLIGECGWKERH